MKMVKSLEESGLLIKWISETIKNEKKRTKRIISPNVIRTVAASILGNELAGKWMGRGGEVVIRAGQNF